MAATRDDGAEVAKPKSPARSDARLARQAEALRANLKRRKAQSRGRADKPDDDPSAGD